MALIKNHPNLVELIEGLLGGECIESKITPWAFDINLGLGVSDHL